MRCSSARPLVLQRCKSEPAMTAAAKMAAGAPGADATTAECFWAHGGSSGRRRHAPLASGEGPMGAGAGGELVAGVGRAGTHGSASC
ncbi:hypothetical protein C2845_PM13G25670 [Panicum miliaceum]|uniref:Uncharacterized protein n=1 Tax=Panicum miliaceum TaxID=4540 RepID=A0A3L6RGY2_PANMI|nr:hypothetical protein C2845_PM13G25670 [Panicum miliaceum]